MQKFPSLGNYAECWPLTDAIRLHLKYTAGRAKVLDERDAAASTAAATAKASKRPRRR